MQENNVKILTGIYLGVVLGYCDTTIAQHTIFYIAIRFVLC
jgi:hypothetical protein